MNYYCIKVEKLCCNVYIVITKKNGILFNSCALFQCKYKSSHQESLQLNSENISGIYWFLPDHAFTVGQLMYQEGQDSGFLSRCVSLKGFGPQTQSKIS